MILRRTQKDINICQIRENSSANTEFEIDVAEAMACPGLEKLWLVEGRHSLLEKFPSLTNHPVIFINEEMSANIFWGFSYRGRVEIKVNGSAKLFFMSHAGFANLLNKVNTDCSLEDLYKSSLRDDFNAFLRECLSKISYSANDDSLEELEKLFHDQAIDGAKTFFGERGLGIRDFHIRDFQILD